MNIIDSFKEKIKDGLTLQEIGQLFTEFIQTGVIEYLKITIPGTEKKEKLMEQVGILFDLIAPAIPLPMFFTPIRLILRPYLRKIVLAICDGAIEGVYNRVHVEIISSEQSNEGENSVSDGTTTQEAL